MLHTGPTLALLACALLTLGGCAEGQDAPAPEEATSDAATDSSLPDALPDSGNPDGDAGSDAPDEPCLCGAPGCGICPTVAAIGINGAEIDSIEVTNEQYAEWLSADPVLTDQPPGCEGNTTFVPAGAWPGDDNLPVTHVDWCDATAYCVWARKRLCGARGGGPATYADFADPQESEWTHACVGDGAATYPYGDTYDPLTCNGSDYGAGAKTPAGEVSCQGGFPGLFDMSGNVWEWEDSCETGLADALCRIRGGSFSNNADSLRCTVDSGAERTSSHASIGFRCCGD